MIKEQIKLIHGDCLEVMKAIPDESIDLVVTDPPYQINYKSKWNLNGNTSKSILGDNDYNLIKLAVSEMYRVLKNNSAAYIFCSPKKIDYFMECCKESGFVIKNIIIWVKNNWTSGDLKAADEKIVTATTQYGKLIHASVEWNNVFACQFHPEKSSRTGLAILKNFINIK